MSNPDAATADQDAPQGSTTARAVLVIAVIVFSLIVSVIAGIESFFAFRGLAVFFGWDAGHAWMIWPLVEVFLLLGSAELALRVMQDPDPKLAGPRVMSYGALLVTLAVNVGYRVLTLILPTAAGVLIAGGVLHNVPLWQVLCLGAFAAIVPVAQLAALHTLMGRLRRLAQERARTRATAPAVTESGPKLGSLLRRAAAQRIEQSIEARAIAAAGTPEGTPAITTGHAPAVTLDAAQARADSAPGRVPADGEARADASGAAPGARASATGRTRASSATSAAQARAGRATGHAADTADQDAGTRAEAAFAQYTAVVETNGSEPDGATIAGWMRVQNPATGRKARGEFRVRYAREVVEGTRAAPQTVPAPLANQLGLTRIALATDTANDVTDGPAPTTETARSGGAEARADGAEAHADGAEAHAEDIVATPMHSGLSATDAAPADKSAPDNVVALHRHERDERAAVAAGAR